MNINTSKNKAKSIDNVSSIFNEQTSEQKTLSDTMQMPFKELKGIKKISNHAKEENDILRKLTEHSLVGGEKSTFVQTCQDLISNREDYSMSTEVTGFIDRFTGMSDMDDSIEVSQNKTGSPPIYFTVEDVIEENYVIEKWSPKTAKAYTQNQIHGCKAILERGLDSLHSLSDISDWLAANVAVNGDDQGQFTKIAYDFEQMRKEYVYPSDNMKPMQTCLNTLLDSVKTYLDHHSKKPWFKKGKQRTAMCQIIAGLASKLWNDYREKSINEYHQGDVSEINVNEKKEQETNDSKPKVVSNAIMTLDDFDEEDNDEGSANTNKEKIEITETKETTEIKNDNDEDEDDPSQIINIIKEEEDTKSNYNEDEENNNEEIEEVEEVKEVKEEKQEENTNTISIKTNVQSEPSEFAQATREKNKTFITDFKKFTEPKNKKDIQNDKNEVNQKTIDAINDYVNMLDNPYTPKAIEGKDGILGYDVASIKKEFDLKTNNLITKLTDYIDFAMVNKTSADRLRIVHNLLRDTYVQTKRFDQAIVNLKNQTTPIPNGVISLSDMLSNLKEVNASQIEFQKQGNSTDVYKAKIALRDDYKGHEDEDLDKFYLKEELPALDTDMAGYVKRRLAQLKNSKFNRFGKKGVKSKEEFRLQGYLSENEYDCGIKIFTELNDLLDNKDIFKVIAAEKDLSVILGLNFDQIFAELDEKNTSLAKAKADFLAQKKKEADANGKSLELSPDELKAFDEISVATHIENTFKKLKLGEKSGAAKAIIKGLKDLQAEEQRLSKDYIPSKLDDKTKKELLEPYAKNRGMDYKDFINSSNPDDEALANSVLESYCKDKIAAVKRFFKRTTGKEAEFYGQTKNNGATKMDNASKNNMAFFNIGKAIGQQHVTVESTTIAVKNIEEPIQTQQKKDEVPDTTTLHGTTSCVLMETAPGEEYSEVMSKVSKKIHENRSKNGGVTKNPPKIIYSIEAIRNLIHMQILDNLTAQTDRHGRNFKVRTEEKNGNTVILSCKGYDQDQAFSKVLKSSSFEKSGTKISDKLDMLPPLTMWMSKKNPIYQSLVNKGHLKSGNPCDKLLTVPHKTDSPATRAYYRSLNEPEDAFRKYEVGFEKFQAPGAQEDKRYKIKNGSAVRNASLQKMDNAGVYNQHYDDHGLLRQDNLKAKTGWKPSIDYKENNFYHFLGTDQLRANPLNIFKSNILQDVVIKDENQKFHEQKYKGYYNDYAKMEVIANAIDAKHIMTHLEYFRQKFIELRSSNYKGGINNPEQNLNILLSDEALVHLIALKEFYDNNKGTLVDKEIAALKNNRQDFKDAGILPSDDFAGLLDMTIWSLLKHYKDKCLVEEDPKYIDKLSGIFMEKNENKELGKNNIHEDKKLNKTNYYEDDEHPGCVQLPTILHMDEATYYQLKNLVENEDYQRQLMSDQGWDEAKMKLYMENINAQFEELNRCKELAEPILKAMYGEDDERANFLLNDDDYKNLGFSKLSEFVIDPRMSYFGCEDNKAHLAFGDTADFESPEETYQDTINKRNHFQNEARMKGLDCLEDDTTLSEDIDTEAELENEEEVAGLKDIKVN